MRTCENCKYSEPIMGGLACMGQKGMPYVRPTGSCDRWKTMKQSNADRIRSMTDEELAIWLASITDCGECEIYSYKDGCMASDEACACQWLYWLRQEAAE